MSRFAATVAASLVTACVAASVSVAQTTQAIEPSPSSPGAERRAIARAYQSARDLRDTDPARYVAETEAYLDRGERLAQADAGSNETQLLRRDLAEAAHHAGSFARFTLHDAARGIRLHRRSLALRAGLQGSESLGAGTHMAIADALRFDAKDTTEALAECRTLLALLEPLDLRDDDSNSGVMRAIMQWARAEIAYLANGRHFSGTVPMETVVTLALAIDLGTQGLAADDHPLAAIDRALIARIPPATERETDPTGFVTRGAFAALKMIEQEGKGNHVGMHVHSWSATDRGLMRNAERLALRK